MKTLIVVLVIFPWSFLFGLAYLVYRRVRGQQRASREFIEAARITEPMSEERKQWMADCVAQSKRAEQVNGTFEISVEHNQDLLRRLDDALVHPRRCTSVLGWHMPGSELCPCSPCTRCLPEEDIMQQKPLDGWRTADADYVANIGRA